MTDNAVKPQPFCTRKGIQKAITRFYIFYHGLKTSTLFLNPYGTKKLDSMVDIFSVYNFLTFENLKKLSKSQKLI